MDAGLQRLGRREWWLWWCTLVVTTLSWTVLLLTLFPGLFRYNDHFFEIGSDQARWANFSLLLLFDTWLIHRQRLFRRTRKVLADSSGDEGGIGRDAYDARHTDPITGLFTRSGSEPLLAREVVRARRQNTPLSLVAFHLDDFASLNQLHGDSAGESVAKEFAGRLRKASRGSDFGVQLDRDDFLLVLPECSLAEAKNVIDRMGAVEVNCAGQNIVVAYSVGWVDYKRGEVPSDLFKRAGDILRLYGQASKANGSTTLLLR